MARQVTVDTRIIDLLGFMVSYVFTKDNAADDDFSYNVKDGDVIVTEKTDTGAQKEIARIRYENVVAVVAVDMGRIGGVGNNVKATP